MKNANVLNLKRNSRLFYCNFNEENINTDGFTCVDPVYFAWNTCRKAQICKAPDLCECSPHMCRVPRCSLYCCLASWHGRKIMMKMLPCSGYKCIPSFTDFKTSSVYHDPLTPLLTLSVNELKSRSLISEKKLSLCIIKSNSSLKCVIAVSPLQLDSVICQCKSSFSKHYFPSRLLLCNRLMTPIAQCFRFT